MFKNAFGKARYIPVPFGNERNARSKADPGQMVCPSCGMPFTEEQAEVKVCPSCHNHVSMTAWERIDLLADKSSFQEMDTSLDSYNPLEFPGYTEKLQEAQEKTGLSEAIVTGSARIGGFTVVMGVMDSRFMMGSMGSVVGEKICRAIEKAIELECPLLIFATSGGARMQEGMLALMQMARTSAALQRLHEKGLLFISVLTHPTTGGVYASFASLADMIIAEPGALVGFTGQRVIQQTLGQRLPERFQRAEFILDHGLVDMVLDRTLLKETLERILRLHRGGN